MDCLEIITSFWGKIQDTQDVDIDCNFFDAGGTSLQLTTLAAELETAFGFRVSVMDAFQYPTIAALAGHLEKKMR